MAEDERSTAVEKNPAATKPKTAPIGWEWFRVRRALPVGILLCALITILAETIATYVGGAVMLIALVIGIAGAPFAHHKAVGAGVTFSSKTLLRIGVALLGARIGFQEIAALGWPPLAFVAVAVALTIAFGAWLGRRTRLGTSVGVLTGGATAICGASAALAISAVLPSSPRQERDTVFTIAAVTSLSTLAMVLYPVLARLLGFDDVQTGYLIGGSIHDVAQVVGAGYAVSEEAGDVATLTKLFRVALLLPVVLALSLLFSARAENGKGRFIAPPPMLIGFIVLAMLNSVGLLPAWLVATLAQTSTFLLITAVAAIGLRTSISEMRSLGWVPLAVVTGETLFILGLLLIAAPITF